MELQFYGANCVRLTTKKVSIIIDDNLADLGLKSVTKSGDIALFTGAHGEAAGGAKLVFNRPGEYEASDTSVQGISARAHIDEDGKKTAIMFKVIGEDVRVAVLGHVYPSLSNEQLEQLGTIDVLLIPVGGNGYTLDPVGALKLIKAIDPKIVIPTHYADNGINYPVSQQSLEDALKGLSMEPAETLPKLKVKAGEMGENTRLIVLER
jgi:L-ascorbate metabolism protein UlaG (beta-lactamase superfamily)